MCLVQAEHSTAPCQLRGSPSCSNRAQLLPELSCQVMPGCSGRATADGRQEGETERMNQVDATRQHREGGQELLQAQSSSSLQSRRGWRSRLAPCSLGERHRADLHLRKYLSPLNLPKLWKMLGQYTGCSLYNTC